MGVSSSMSAVPSAIVPLTLRPSLEGLRLRALLRQRHQSSVLRRDLIPGGLEPRRKQTPCGWTSGPLEVETLEVRGAKRAREIGICLSEHPVYELEAAFVRRQIAATLGSLGERRELPHLKVRLAAELLDTIAQFGELAKDGAHEVEVRVNHDVLLPLSDEVRLSGGLRPASHTTPAPRQVQPASQYPMYPGNRLDA